MKEPLPQSPRWARHLPLPPTRYPAIWPIQVSWTKLSVGLKCFGADTTDLSGSKNSHQSILSSEEQLTPVWCGALLQPGTPLVPPPVLCKSVPARLWHSPFLASDLGCWCRLRLGHVLQPPLLLPTAPQRFFLWERRSVRPHITVLLPTAEHLIGHKPHREAVLSFYVLLRLAQCLGGHLPLFAPCSPLRCPPTPHTRFPHSPHPSLPRPPMAVPGWCGLGTQLSLLGWLFGREKDCRHLLLGDGRMWLSAASKTRLRKPLSLDIFRPPAFWFICLMLVYNILCLMRKHYILTWLLYTLQRVPVFFFFLF